MTYIHVAEGCWIESEMHRGRLICALFVRTWHKQVFSLQDADGMANSLDADQQSDLGLHCLPRPVCPKT